MEINDVILIAVVFGGITLIWYWRSMRKMKKFSLLQTAIDKDEVKFKEALKANKGDVNEVDITRYSALIVSTVNFGVKSIAIQLLDKGAFLDWPDVRGNTALHYAVMNNNKILIELFVKRGADLSLKNTDGKTALDLAKETGEEDINLSSI